LNGFVKTRNVLTNRQEKVQHQQVTANNFPRKDFV